jgi:threonine dehydrogenase-like Zn-dependent dehydrogenase
MNQVVLNKPGDFTLSKVSDPARKPDEVLVRVQRIGICGTDIHAFHGRQAFFNYPRVLGHELAVEVLEVPAGCESLHPGDRCSVEPYLNCGQCQSCRNGKTNCCEKLQVLGVHTDGGMQTLLSLPVRKLHKGNQLSLDQLALVETLGIGAHGIERADVKAGDYVLIIGAGPIGVSALIFALARGARVAMMDVSEHRLAFCRRQFGGAATVNALGGDIAAKLREIGGGELPLAVVDATGNQASMQGCFDFVAHGGCVVYVGLYAGAITFDDPNFHRRELTLYASRNSLPSKFEEIIALIASGKIVTTPWITRRLALEDVPSKFSEVTADPLLLKAMIEV